MHDNYSFEYRKCQRELFRGRNLASEWFKSYPQIFDKDDLRLAKSQPRYHFFEWLGAIILFNNTTCLSLVEQYQFPSHKRKRKMLADVVPDNVFKLITSHKEAFGSVQCPDLLVYNPANKDWFFCEVKGPGDKLGTKQSQFFDALEQVSQKPIRIMRFKRLPRHLH
jgi:hypothetical protein